MKTLRKICCLALCLACLLVLPQGLAEGGKWLETTLDFRGYPLEVKGYIWEDYPLPLKQVQLIAGDLDIHQATAALGQYFELSRPAEQVVFQNEPHYFSYGLKGLEANWLTGWQYDHDIDQVFDLEDPQVQNLYEKALAYLEHIGYKGMRNVGYACHYAGYEIIPKAQFGTRAGDKFRIHITLDIDGLSTMQEAGMVSRGLVQPSDITSRYMMDYPYAVFMFDTQYQLVLMGMSFYRIQGERALEGPPIPWQEAVFKVLEAPRAQAYFRVGEDLGPDELAKRLFSQYRVRLVRVYPLWMPGWLNLCIPGWGVQIQLYDARTDEFVISFYFSVDARTGAFMTR